MTTFTLANARDFVGREIGLSDWLLVDQRRIDLFAEATGDDYWIHTDPGRARTESPFGTTVAHGFLTLSLLVPLYYDSVRRPEPGVTALNYGVDRVRFIAPVKQGDRIRARFVLDEIEDGEPGRLMLVIGVTMEIEGGERPAMVARCRNLYLWPKEKTAPRLSAEGAKAQSERFDRAAEALRANLKRRKDQTRARKD
ncbi:MAG: MaoC family dehydratase [Alphaproteobacteria bacterium]